jgi:hypothetical protein
MWSIRLIARVPLAKQWEFLDAARAAGINEGSSPTFRVLVLKASTGDDLFCWMADGETGGELRALLISPAFLALKGAVHVLGTLIDFSVLEEQEGILLGLPSPRPAVGGTRSVWGDASSVWTIRLVVHVPPDQRRRFADSAIACLEEETAREPRAWTLEGLDHPDLLCCMIDVASFAALAELLESGALRALEELARRQGTLETPCVLRTRWLDVAL